MKLKSILPKTFIVLTILGLSCKPDLNEIKPVITPQNNDLTIDQAKDWFQNNHKVLNSNLEKSIGKVVYWNEAKEIKLPNNKNFILVDANYSDSNGRVSSIINEEDGSDKWKKADKEIKKNRKGYSTILKLLVYKNEAGELEKKLLRIIPTETYRNKSKEKEIYLNDFSGYITANDWETENLIDGESIINGKVIGQLTFVNSKIIKGAKANNSQNCTVTTIATSTEVPCSGGGMVPGGPQQKISSETMTACYETQYSSTLSCYTGGISGGNVSSYFNIINQGSGGSGYLGTESNSSFFSRWYQSMEQNFNISFTAQEIQFLNDNLEMIPLVENYLRVPENDRPNLGIIGNSIRKDFLNSDFEKDLFERYILGGGNLRLYDFRFNDIVSKANYYGNKEGAPYTVQYTDMTCTAQLFNFYNSTEYDYALGKATLYYSIIQNKYIGIYDFYDFNKLKGSRPALAEAATRGISALYPNAKAYHIQYP